MIAITLDNFQQVVVEESKNKLVLVSFWAEQVPESVELRNKLAAKLSNLSEHITLATVDCQSQGQIAEQFGIKGLPTAILLKDAQPLDGISGPQDDASIATFLDSHLPKPEDILLAQAKAALGDNLLVEAENIIMQAYQIDNNRADIKVILIDLYLQTGKTSEAKALLDTIMMVDQDSQYHALIAKLELAEQAENSPEIKALEAQLEATPDDINVSQQLAAQYSQVNRQEDALTILFRLVQAGDESTKERSKELFLDVLKALPDGDPLAAKFRRKLYTLMY
ncbi:tetratricopeptide repeat protein [Colwellia psychrerythraea]|uniref:Thioredoxin domain protein n=1 Tax=Colwellia psychrerythraea (strain 34H / ATCC BAA-681) TaxID=167879 RepID=Q47W30_COLP3|nr:tetratricopeptide repeat protein [Colwellia psychrerythraea]AAZ28745.1 thioredoxin domain protein [Colwellia psychrerythraea 34H]